MEFDRLKAELQERANTTTDRWLEFTEILDNISFNVSQELKRKKSQKQEQQQNQRPMKQASKVRIMENQTSDILTSIKMASPNQSTILYTPDQAPLPQRERR